MKYCSDRCRRAGAPAADDPFEAAILTLLSERAGGASICPSEAARRVGGDEWRGKMAHVRAAGARLASQGRVEFTQGGGVVQPERARGPVRIRLRRGGPNP